MRRAARRRAAPRPRRRAGTGALAAAVIGAGVLGIGGCSTAGGSAPAVAPPTSGGATVGPATTVGSSAPAAPTGTTAYVLPPMPQPSAALPSPGDNRVYVLGDSVILGAQQTLPAALKGWKVTFDAQESRLIDQGLAVLKQKKAAAVKKQADERDVVEKAYADAGLPAPKAEPAPTVEGVLGRVVVVSLCTNYLAGNGFAGWIDQFMALLSEIDRVVWVTCREWSPGQVEANQAMWAALAKYKTMVLADWAPFGPAPGFTYDDGIHLQDAGRKAMADVVALAVGAAPAAPVTTTTSTTLPKPTTTVPATTTPAPAPR